MKLSLVRRLDVTSFFTSILGAGLLLSGCAFLERADAEKGQGDGDTGDGDGDGDGSGGSSASGGSPNLGGAGTGGGPDAGYNGCSPIEPDCEMGAGTNLIDNGDFAGGITGWNGQNGTLDVSSGAGCIDAAAAPADPAGIGWGDAGTNAALQPGTYVFSFDVTVDGTPTLLARVGGVTDPWPTYFEEDLGAVASGPQSLEFTVTEAVNAGVVFFLNGGRVCVDNVSLAAK